MRRPWLVSMLVVAGFAFAGCTGPTNPDDSSGDSGNAADRWSPNKWRDALTEPRLDGVQTSVYYIEAADGAQLSLTLHLPQGLNGGETVPTLMEITPYQSPDFDTPLFRPAAPSPSWQFFVERGAAYVEADARGTTASEGCLDFGGALDRSDARTFVAWVRSQPWSNGVVVTDGVSHPGMGSVVAHAAVPELEAALAVAPVVSYYRDQWYQGAKYDTQFNGIYQAIEAYPAVYSDPDAIAAQAAPCTGQTLLDYEHIDGPFTKTWADRDLSRHVDNVIEAGTPILLEHGFVDLNVFPDHSQIYWDALPHDFPKRMVMGWWYHARPDFSGHPAEADADYRHRFMDTTLFGIENGFWNEPRVLVEDSEGTWHESHDWPLDGSQVHAWYPSAGGDLSASAPDSGTATFDDVAGDSRYSWDTGHVVFRSPALVEDTLINGAPTLHLTASSTAPETKWVVYLLSEASDGSWQRITHGFADSHTHGEEDQWLDMEPGKTYEWVIDLLPTAVVVPKGHRVALLIASQDTEETDAGQTRGCWDDHRGGCYRPSGILPATTVGRATNSVHLGQGQTFVEFAAVNPDDTNKPPWPAAGP